MRKESSKPLSPAQQAGLDALTVLSDSTIDTRDIPEVVDWSGAQRGVFYQAVKEALTKP